jgi:hypothetical protein
MPVDTDLYGVLYLKGVAQIINIVPYCISCYKLLCGGLATGKTNLVWNRYGTPGTAFGKDKKRSEADVKL